MKPGEVHACPHGFNGGRHAHAAESSAPRDAARASGLLQCFNGGRHAHAAECSEWRPDRLRRVPALQWRAACACRRIPSAFNFVKQSGRWTASMEGGMRMPPNRILAAGSSTVTIRSRFNGGRHAHAAESDPATPSRQTPPVPASMEGGMRMPPNRQLRPRFECRSVPRFNGGRHAHAAESAARGCCTDQQICASMERGMRMPPNWQWVRPALTHEDARMEGGAHAPNVTVDAASVHRNALQWRAACACRRMPLCASGRH